jgi:hypothetical protein
MNHTTTHRSTSTQTYEVGGVRMGRPFKIRRFGHFGFNLDRLEEGLGSTPTSSGSASPTTCTCSRWSPKKPSSGPARSSPIPACCSPPIARITMHCLPRGISNVATGFLVEGSY